MQSNKYDEVVVQSRQRILANPEDGDAIYSLASALRAQGEYHEAVQWLERLDILRKRFEALYPPVRGGPGSGLTIACLQWMMGNRSEGVSRMHGMVAGILDGSIQYGDAAGGMEQGLLLHYMGVTEKQPDEISYALNYLRNRVKRLRSRLQNPLTVTWPCSVAEYLLGDVGFDAVKERINREGPRLNVPDAAERYEQLRRFRLATAVFHDGVKSRAAGDEDRCLARMRECCELVDPPLSNRDYLARDEVRRSETK
jgi:tetratricopeptide (TPR) repeat protein